MKIPMTVALNEASSLDASAERRMGTLFPVIRVDLSRQILTQVKGCRRQNPAFAPQDMSIHRTSSLDHREDRKDSSAGRCFFRTLSPHTSLTFLLLPTFPRRAYRRYRVVLRAPMYLFGKLDPPPTHTRARAHRPHVLAMAYGYGSIESSTSTRNSSAPSPTPSPSPSAQPMSSSSNGLGLVAKEKAHLAFAGFRGDA